MPWRASPDSRIKCDAIYHRTLRFLFDNATRDGQSPREFAPGEIAQALGYTGEELEEAQKIVGTGLMKFYRQGLIEWNRLFRPRRKYWIEEKHFTGVKARLDLFEVAEKAAIEPPESGPGYVQERQTQQRNQRVGRRW